MTFATTEILQNIIEYNRDGYSKLVNGGRE